LVEGTRAGRWDVLTDVWARWGRVSTWGRPHDRIGCMAGHSASGSGRRPRGGEAYCRRAIDRFLGPDAPALWAELCGVVCSRLRDERARRPHDRPGAGPGRRGPGDLAGGLPDRRSGAQTALICDFWD